MKETGTKIINIKDYTDGQTDIVSNNLTNTLHQGGTNNLNQVVTKTTEYINKKWV